VRAKDADRLWKDSTGEGAKARVLSYVLLFEKRAWSELSPELCPGIVLAKANWRGPKQSHGVKLHTEGMIKASLLCPCAFSSSSTFRF